MIEEFVSISTLMICTFLSTMVVGIFMLQVWLTDRRHAAAGYWCLAMWVGSLCTILFALRPIGFPLITVGLGNALAAFSYAFMWAGFRDLRSSPALSVGGACGADSLVRGLPAPAAGGQRRQQSCHPDVGHHRRLFHLDGPGYLGGAST
ncbi:hypothetical protein [Sinorhizobium sp. RAC02]|uniref:hypothetical protein n=1 Tax=Sinorhizobium sp. RAC02 TaxID=1842534 RepID=UPI001495F0AE|nr:hypothetical protein [Sinorhizobium sp. RAC02]